MINLASSMYINETHLSGNSDECWALPFTAAAWLLQRIPLVEQWMTSYFWCTKASPPASSGDNCMVGFTPRARLMVRPSLGFTSNPTLAWLVPCLMPSHLLLLPPQFHTFYKAWAPNLWSCSQLRLFRQNKTGCSSMMESGWFRKKSSASW